MTDQEKMLKQIADGATREDLDAAVLVTWRKDGTAQILVAATEAHAAWASIQLQRYIR